MRNGLTKLRGIVRRAVARLTPLEEILKRAYPVALACAEWRISIVRLRGTTRAGHQGTAIVVGQEPWVSYLPSLFFSTVTGREPLGAVPVWRLEQRLKILRSSADLTIIRIDRFSAALFLRGAYLAIPAWINAVLHVPGDTRDLARGNHSLKVDLRLVKRGNFQAQVTQADSDLAFFYESLYVPFMRRRHADLAFVRDEFWLRHRCRKGGILWISQAGKRIAGGLFERRGQVLHAWAEGVLSGDPALLKQGAAAALYFHMITYARQQGCRYVDFGATRPCLGDGLLRYKRKWGMTFTEKPDNHYSFLVQWNEWNKAVASFFAETPLLYRGHAGLSAVTSVPSGVAATEADAIRAHHAFWTKGLDRLCIISDSGWQSDIRTPSDTWLLDRPFDGNNAFDALLDRLGA